MDPLPLDKVTADAVTAAVDDAIAAGEARLAEIVAAEPSWAKVMAPLAQLEADLGVAYGRGPFLGHVHPDPAIRQAGRTAEERLMGWQVRLPFRRDLYEAVVRYAATDEAAGLAGERRRYLDFVLRDFRMAGQDLDEARREELLELRSRLVELEVAFSTNLAEYEDAIEVPEADLTGLPDDYVARLKPGETPGTRRIGLDYPELVPFMELSPHRHHREELFRRFNRRAAEENRPLLKEAVRIRHRIAELFDLPSWAHYRMQDKMARTPERVMELYDRLIGPLTARGEEEKAVLTELLRADHGPDAQLEPWDRAYYETALRRSRGIDPTELAAYLPLDQVLEGLFDLTAEVFGLRYVPVPDARAWHEDVMLYEIRDRETDELIAWFYADLFPRPGKYGHAAAFPLVPGHVDERGVEHRPVSAIVANLTPPSGDRPSLLQHQEVETLFHEFGHILHMSLSRASIARFSAANTEWDFVEAPSQIMEHWVWEPEVMDRFARHHETGAPLPASLVRSLVDTRYLNAGLHYLRQLSLGSMDLGLHGPGWPKDIDAILREAYRVSLFELPEGTFPLAGFGHLMGGYDAGYYGYIWAEVFGDDMFSAFVEAGVTDPVVGRRYRRTILEPGGTKDAEQLLLDFLGRPPSDRAFLAKLGLTGDD